MGRSLLLERPTEIDVNVINVLWMDDQPGNIKTLIKMSPKELNGNRLIFHVATSIEETRQLLQQNLYSALIIDCQMDTSNKTGENGAEFLLEINNDFKYLPTFVWTAFKDDDFYEEYLENSNAIVIDEKTGSFELPMESNFFFMELFKYAHRCFEVINLNPEDIGFQDYISDPEKYQKQISSHWQKHGNWITKELKRKNWVWGVVCGTEIVKGSQDLFEFPSSDELYELGKYYNKVPFAYNLAEEPETIDPPGRNDVSWNKTIYHDDYYPTLKVCIEGQILIDDFDTGAFQTQVSDEIITPRLFDALQRKEESHLGEEFYFFTRKVPIELLTDNRGIITSEVTVRVIKDWSKSSFTKINPQRKTLLGRDLLRAFPSVEIVLSSVDNSTQIRSIDRVES